ncbi:hypothetical protein [Microbacterium gorillae]|uniref:hypothetical protein n=1 Tax=Microbacterium gorillae TaxID=1231063 RepID=UPI003D959B96
MTPLRTAPAPSPRHVARSHGIVFRILATSPEPLTLAEIVEQAAGITNLSASRIRSAVPELRRKGEITYASISRRVPRHPVGHHVLARFNDQFHECSLCDVEHWWRQIAGDLWRAELVGPCGNSMTVNFSEEGCF